MPSFLIRFASVAAVLLAAQLTGEGQGLVPRGQPAGPMVQPGYPVQPAYPVQPGYAPAAALPTDRMSVVDPDKKLSAGDQVTLEIVEDREGGLPRVVTATGELDVPPLGRVKVSGKTAAEASSVIKSMLERDYYYTATVRLSIDQVSRVQVQSGVVYLSGEVRVVGPQFIVAGETLTLSRAILKAGGLTQWANQKAVRLTRQKDGNTVPIEVNYKKVIETGNEKDDPVLQDGDRIYVPKVFFRGF